MRRLIQTVLGAALLAAPARAQQAPSATPAAPADSSRVQAPPAPAQAQRAPLSGGERARLLTQLAFLRLRGLSTVPAADSFARGGRTIPAGTTVRGSVGAVDGDLVVAGRLEGDAFAVGGNVLVRDGGEITGDAVAVNGRVRLEGGRVDGDMSSFTSSATGFRSDRARPPLTTWEMVKLVTGWFAILFAIGIGVLVFADSSLDGVVVALERGFGRAFWIGLLGQVALLPTLLLLVVGLCLTVIGILLVPFAIVAYCIAAAGVFTLGFLAVARMTGGGIARARPAAPRAEALRGLLIGLVAFFAIWVVAAAFTWSPVVGSILRGIAIAVTWVAATVGFGAALASRAGTQRPGAGRPTPKVADDLAWMTPTPVTGVAAARRPVSSTTQPGR